MVRKGKLATSNISETGDFRDFAPFQIGPNFPFGHGL